MALGSMQLGGGTFSGRASHGLNVFQGYKEDVSQLVTMLSPAETLLLTAIGDPMDEAKSIWHQWLEDDLAPNLIIGSFAVASTAADSLLIVKSEMGRYIQVGAILRGPEAAGGEYVQVITVTPSTLTVSRGFGGTTVNSWGASEYLTVISEAAPEGADVLVDTSRPRTFQGNYTQIFKKDIIVSGTTEAVSQHGVDSEFDYQVQKKLRESLRDLEKALILGVLSGATIGAASLTRTFRGLLQGAATNSLYVSSMGTDFGTATLSYFEAQINNAVQAAWLNGGSDINLFVVGNEVKKRFDQLNSQRVRVPNGDNTFGNLITRYESTHGMFMVQLNRWMPIHSCLMLPLGRIRIMPLTGRSFHLENVAKTGDAAKAMLIGEYTVEQRNEPGMSKITFGSLAPAAGAALIGAR